MNDYLVLINLLIKGNQMLWASAEDSCQPFLSAISPQNKRMHVDGVGENHVDVKKEIHMSHKTEYIE